MCYIVFLYEYFSWGTESRAAYQPVLFPAVREVVYTAQSNIIALSQLATESLKYSETKELNF